MKSDRKSVNWDVFCASWIDWSRTKPSWHNQLAIGKKANIHTQIQWLGMKHCVTCVHICHTYTHTYAYISWDVTEFKYFFLKKYSIHFFNIWPCVWSFILFISCTYRLFSYNLFYHWSTLNMFYIFHIYVIIKWDKWSNVLFKSIYSIIY